VTWVKLDDQFPHHPRVVQAGDMAAWLYVSGLCYAGQFLTDGVIPKGQLRRLTNLHKPEKEAGKLVEAGLWHDKDDHYEIHDYHQWNPPAAKVKAKREADRVRKESARNPDRQTEESPRNPNVRSSSDPKGLLKSSSSEPLVAGGPEEDEVRNEAQRRLKNRIGTPLVDVGAWLRKTEAGVRAERLESQRLAAEIARVRDCELCRGKGVREVGLEVVLCDHNSQESA
jgi:hypothetical protein